MSEVKIHGQKIPIRLIGLTALFAVCLSVVTALLKKDSIEINLIQETRKALSSAGLPMVDVNFTGRTAILSGSVKDASVSGDVVTTVENISGVQKISNLIEIEPEETIYVTASSVDPEFENGFYVPSRTHPLEKYNMSKVEFVYAKSTLTDSSLPILDKLAMILQRNNQIQIELSVHTDNQGTALGQIVSSESRAENLREYLIDQGVSPEQLFTTGYGATRPIASNDTDEGQQKNRRVEITVLKDQ